MPIKFLAEGNYYCNIDKAKVLELFRLISDNPIKYSAMLNAKGRKNTPKRVSEPRKLYAWMSQVLPDIAKNISVKEKCYWILNGLTDFPNCQTCGLKLSSKHFRGLGTGYSPFCQFACYAKTEIFKAIVRNTNKKAIEANPNCLKERAAKGTATKLAKYGAYESWTTTEKRRRTIAKRIEADPDFYFNREQKTRKTKIENGHSPTWHNVEQAVATRFSRNGGKWNSKKTIAIRKRNSLLKYGTDDPAKAEIVKRHHADAIRRKYGVKSYTQTLMFKQHMLKISEQRKAKEHATKLKNNSFNRSKPEDECYWILKFVCPRLIRQYRSEEYPFSCDFYDPDSQTYFEFNGTWTHGGHFFNLASEADKAKLAKWKAKGTKFYANAIRTWTERDVKKKAVAKENRLKYVVFWNISEARSWVLNFNAN